MADISIWRAVWDDDQSMFLWREKTRYLKAVVIFSFSFFFLLPSLLCIYQTHVEQAGHDLAGI